MDKDLIWIKFTILCLGFAVALLGVNMLVEWLDDHTSLRDIFLLIILLGTTFGSMFLFYFLAYRLVKDADE